MFPNLPKGWHVDKLKHLAAVHASNVDKHSVEGEAPVLLCNYTDVYNSDRITAGMPFMQATARAEEIDRFGLRAGDVLITKDSESWNDIAVPALVTENLPGVLCGYHLSQIRPSDSRLDGRFLFYAFKSGPVNSQLQVAANGVTRFGLPAYAIENVELPIPPLHEQRAIATFLDGRTVEIETLIAKKRRLLELLAEKRQAVITRAVTKGLDPTVLMKDTGIPWLGEVPADWEVKRLKFSVPSLTVGIVVTPAKYYESEGVPCLRALNIVTGDIVEDDMVFISPESNDLHSKSKIYAGDVVIVRTGRPGTAAIVTKAYDGANCVDLLIIRQSDELIPNFLIRALGSDACAAQVRRASVGAIQSHYNTGTLGELIVAVPRLAEQDEIVGFLDRRLSGLQIVTLAIRNAIDRLIEYRSALITAAVTGKIDVSGRQPVEAVA